MIDANSAEPIQEVQVEQIGGEDKVKQLFNTLSQDEVYSGLIGDEKTFTEKMRNPEKAKQLWSTLSQDEVYSGLIGDEQTFLSKVSLGKSVPKGGAEPSLGGELQSRELPEIDLPTAMKLKKDIAGVTSAQGLTDLLARPEYKNIAQYAKQFSGLSPLQLSEEISKISVPEKSKKALNYLAKSDKDFYKGERDLNVEGANVMAQNINQATQTLQSSELLLKNGQELFAQFEKTKDPTPIIESLRQLGIQADENNWQQESERLFNKATENIRIAQETLPSQYKEYEKAVKNAETFDRAVVAYNNDEIRKMGLPFQDYIVDYDKKIQAQSNDERQKKEAKEQSSFNYLVQSLTSSMGRWVGELDAASQYKSADFLVSLGDDDKLRKALSDNYNLQREIIDLNMPNADDERLSKAYFDSMNPNDWNWYKIMGDIGNVTGSMLPIMGASLAGGPVGAFTVGGMMVYGDVFNSAKAAGMSANEAALYAMSLSLAIGGLERVSAIPLAKYFKGEGGKQLAKKFAKDLIGSKSIKDYLMVAAKTAHEGTKNITGEIITEGLQTVAEGGSKMLLNENTDLNFQDAPKTIGELGSEVVDVMKATAVGLTPLTAIGSYRTSRSAMNQLKKNAIYNHIVELRNDPELISKKLEYLNGLVSTGKLDPKVFEAEQVELGRIADVLDLYPEINNAEKLTDITELYAEKQTLQERDKLREEKGLPKSNDQRIKDIDTKISEIANSDEYYTELSDIADKGVRDEMAGIMRTRDGLIAELPNADPLLKDKFQEQIDNANNKLTELRNEYFGEVETTEQAAETVVENVELAKPKIEPLSVAELNRISEIESLLSSDNASMQETGSGSLIKEGRDALISELRELKKRANSVSTSEASVAKKDSESKKKSFIEAGEQSKKDQSPKALGDFIIDNAQVGDRIKINKDEYYEVVSRKTSKRNGSTEIELQHFVKNEDTGNFENNPSAVKLFTDKYRGTDQEKLGYKDASDIFESSYINSSGEKIIEQSTYEPKAAEQSAPMPEGVKVEGANTQTDENLRNEKRGQEGRQEVELQVAEDVGGEIAPDVSSPIGMPMSPSVLIDEKSADGWLRGALQNFEGNIRLEKLNELEGVVKKDKRLSERDLDLSLNAIERERVKLETTKEQSTQSPKSEPKSKEQNPALESVESTAKALEENRENDLYADVEDLFLRESGEPKRWFSKIGDAMFLKSKGLKEGFTKDDLKKKNIDPQELNNERNEFLKKNEGKILSEAYHKAKKDGSNPELVKAVEELLTPNTNEKASDKKEDGESLPKGVSSVRTETEKREASPELYSQKEEIKSRETLINAILNNDKALSLLGIKKVPC